MDYPDHKFKIVDEADNGARVAVVYYHASAVMPDGSLAWQIGPGWMDVPLDAEGIPLQGEALLREISDRCPDSLLLRELKKHEVRKKRPVIVSHKALMNKEHPVRKSRPSEQPQRLGAFDLVNVRVK